MNFQLGLEWKLLEQTPDCLTFALVIRNESQSRLLLPVPRIDSIQFESGSTRKKCEWYTCVFYSSNWAGFCLEPLEIKSIPYHVQPNRDASTGDWEWSLNLAVGTYKVWFELKVDESYFCTYSHLRLPQLKGIALDQDAMVWLGEVKSETIDVVIRP